MVFQLTQKFKQQLQSMVTLEACCFRYFSGSILVISAAKSDSKMASNFLINHGCSVSGLHLNLLSNRSLYVHILKSRKLFDIRQAPLIFSSPRSKKSMKSDVKIKTVTLEDPYNKPLLIGLSEASFSFTRNPQLISKISSSP